jgi:hypothetical protein
MLSKHPSLFAIADEESHHLGVALYRTVGYGLRRAHSKRKRAFQMPIVYSSSLADLCVYRFSVGATELIPSSNNWDNMFMERLMGSITMHRPVTAPVAVLALGSGSDFWAIHAAQEWPVCIQPTTSIPLILNLVHLSEMLCHGTKPSRHAQEQYGCASSINEPRRSSDLRSWRSIVCLPDLFPRSSVWTHH